jgi:transcriptional regulator with XRE-family HTH domain
MSQYCNGKVKPKQNKLFLLAAALNVSEAWLMGHDVPRTRTTETTELISSDPVMAAFLRSEKTDLSEEYIKRKIKDSFDITDLERELIIAFRRTDEMTRKNILKLLDIRIKEKNQDVG